MDEFKDGNLGNFLSKEMLEKIFTPPIIQPVVPAMNARDAMIYDENIQYIQQQREKKEKAIFDTAEASKKNVKLLEEQVETLRKQNTLLEKQVDILTEENDRQKIEMEQSNKEAKSAKIFSWVSLGVAIISIGISILLHYIG